MPRPFEDWLAANGISRDDIIMWPKLEVDENLGVIRIESVWREKGADGRDTSVVLGDSAGTIMRKYPLREPMSPELASAWELNAEEARRARLLRNAFYGVPGATVITVREGRNLVFVVQGDMPHSDQRRVAAQVEALLPGVNASIMSGVRMVLVSEDDEERQRRERRGRGY